MVAPLTIGPGIDIGGGIGIGQFGAFYNRATTPSIQNVAGADSVTGFFFTGSWSSLTGVPNLNDVQPGWYVTGHPSWEVVSTDPVTQTITINGGAFLSGEFYTFTGI